MPDAKGNQHASGDPEGEMGPDQHLTEQVMPEAIGTAAPPTPKPPQGSGSQE